MTKKLWIGIGILILFVPLGLIVPKWFGAGGAWGEWGVDEIEKVAGFVPQGMKRLADIWKAPFSDYALPRQGSGMFSESLGYAASAILGVAVVAGVMFLITKLLKRKNKSA